MASTDREYIPFYNSFVLLKAVDIPSNSFVSCSMTSMECNNSEIILKIEFQISMNNKIKRTNKFLNTVLNDKQFHKIKTKKNFEKRKVLLHSIQNCTSTHLSPRVLSLSNLCNY